jgi:hypothetical protein
MKRFTGMLAGCIVLFAVGAYSQVVTFNSPVPWVTQRNDSITVRAQIDTAQIKKKEFAVSVDLVNEGGARKSLAKKTFKITDYTAEFAVGPVSQNLVGGLSYIKIDWSIPGTVNKGTISPVGIVGLDKLPKPDSTLIVHVKDGADAAAVGSLVKESDLKVVGAGKFAFCWTKEALYIVIAKTKTPGTVRFAIDGKNGKNAFCSFADRVIQYQPDKDSVWGSHFSRQLVADTLKYVEQAWPSEITKTALGDKVVIRVPWYDTGIIPVENRRFGIGIMEFSAADKQTAAVPASGKFFMPGTWGDFVLAK